MKLEVEIKKRTDEEGDTSYRVYVNEPDAEFVFGCSSRENAGDAFEGALLQLLLDKQEPEPAEL